MSLTTPTTKTINDNIIAQLEASLNQSIPLLPKAFLRVLAKTLAGVFIVLYKYGGFIFLQMFAKTAINETVTINGIEVNPLVFWGRLIGIGDAVKAVSAELLIDITVTTQTGTLPSGSQLIGQLNGVTYLTLTTVNLNAATVQVNILAVSDQSGGNGSGTVGNLLTGDIVSFASPLANVSIDAVVVSQTVTGSDAESTESYRQRVIDGFKKRPQGGAYADYEQWALESVGIINTYPYTSDNPGQVDVYCEATPASSGSPDGIPTTAQLINALSLINLDDNGLATRRPANALANTFAITRKGFDVTVVELVVDDIVTVKADINTAVTEFFLNAAPYIDGLTPSPRLDRITNSGLTGLIDDIVSSVNGTFLEARFSNAGMSGNISIYVLDQGEKAKLTNPVIFI